MFLDNLFKKSSLYADYGKRLEIEISTSCPIRCCLCPRTRPHHEDLDWNNGFMEIQHIIKLIKNTDTERVIFSGSYGDPIYHPNYHELISLINKELPQLFTNTETNGAHMPSQWWQKLSDITTAKHRYTFSIDGLEDTNHLYREGSNWESIINGIKILREKHLGHMEWKWIVFKHNQHQIEEGYKLSKELGFNSFKLIDSSRYLPHLKPTLPFDEILSNFREIQ